MILFDHKIFFLQKHGGISRYIIELCKKLKENKNEYLVQALIHNNIYLKNSNINKSQNLYLNKYPKFSRKIIEYINNHNIEKKINSEKFKILHNTYYGKYKTNNKISKITSVYDFIHEIFSKEYNYKENIKRNAIDNSDHFICISNNTKNDLIKYYNVDEKKISVVYLGGDHLPKSNSSYNEKPFVLYVGYRGKYKNFEILLDSFNQSSKLKKDFKIICYGDSYFTKKELSKINHYKLSEKIEHISGDDQLLSNLYSSAKCHVITSKYEGFGITAVEAYNFDCPVVQNNNSSLNEVGYKKNSFNGSSEELTNVLENILYSSQIYKDSISAGNKLKEKFNWENCYQNTMQVYKKFGI